MKVQNILTNNIEEVTDFILKELAKLEIPYVYIKEANEIHYNNYILRIYHKNTIIKLNNIVNLNDFLNNLQFDDISIEEVETFNPSKNIIYKDYKYQNYNTNIELKNNMFNNQKVLKRQLNPTRKVYRRKYKKY